MKVIPNIADSFKIRSSVLFRLFYSLSIRLYYLLLRLAAPFNTKARQWLRGRAAIFSTIENQLRDDASPKAWFHCASLGEFEQARPVIERFARAFPTYSIVLTFFSPSGYEVRKNWTGARHIFYLPLDTKANARKFVKIVSPSIVYFVKYEFWFHYLNSLRRQSIPAISFSAIFRPNQLYFKPAARPYKEVLQSFRHLFVQDQLSLRLLEGQGFDNAELTGDTRFDRVVEIADRRVEIPIAARFKGKRRCFIIGSAWEEDIRVFLPPLLTRTDLKIIIAPHEIREGILSLIEREAGSSIRYSQADETNTLDQQVLIIDNIGMLSSLYAYGDYAAIGGAFGKGLHNTLEAAVYGLPLFFGPNHHKFKEALDLKKAGAAYSVRDQKDFEKQFEPLYQSEERRAELARVATRYVRENTGASDKIIAYSKTLLNL